MPEGEGTVESTGSVQTAQPESGGLADATSQSDPSFALNDDVMFHSDLDSVEIPPESPPAQPSEGATQQPPAPQAQPQQATPQGAQPPAAQPAQAQPTAQAAPSAPQQGAQPYNLQEEFAKHRDALVDNLAQSRFALTPGEIQALNEDAVGVLPKLMARVAFECMTTSMNQIQNLVPRIVEHVSKDMITTNAAEDAFYAKWPGISRTEHASQVNLAANLFRQANPQASRDQAIAAVGAMVSSMLGLKTPVAQANPPPNGARSARPFSPASGGGRVTSTQPVPQPGDMFAGMGANFDE